MDFFRNGNVSTGDVRTTRIAGHQDVVYDVEFWRQNAHRQRIVSHPEPPIPSRLHRDNNANRAVTPALVVDSRHVANVQEHVHDGQPIHHNARRQHVGSHLDAPAQSRRHRDNNAKLDIPSPSEMGPRHATAERENRQPRQQQNPRRRRSLSHSDVPAAPRRHDNTDTNRAVRLFDARGNQYDEVGGHTYNYFHNPPHQRELSRRNASPSTYNGDNATAARAGVISDTQQTPRLFNNQRHSQSVVPTISIETSSSGTLDSYTATHDPPPYPQPFPRLSSTTTLTSSGSTLSSSDTKSQPHGSVTQSLPHPETRPPFVSRYIVFHLDRESTAEKLREVGDNVLILSVKNMTDNNYIGYISEVCHGSSI